MDFRQTPIRLIAVLLASALALVMLPVPLYSSYGDLSSEFVYHWRLRPLPQGNPDGLTLDLALLGWQLFFVAVTTASAFIVLSGRGWRSRAAFVSALVAEGALFVCNRAQSGTVQSNFASLSLTWFGMNLLAVSVLVWAVTRIPKGRAASDDRRLR